MLRITLNNQKEIHVCNHVQTILLSIINKFARNVIIIVPLVKLQMILGWRRKLLFFIY